MSEAGKKKAVATLAAGGGQAGQTATHEKNAEKNDDTQDATRTQVAHGGRTVTPIALTHHSP